MHNVVSNRYESCGLSCWLLSTKSANASARLQRISHAQLLNAVNFTAKPPMGREKSPWGSVLSVSKITRTRSPKQVKWHHGVTRLRDQLNQRRHKHAQEQMHSVKQVCTARGFSAHPRSWEKRL